MCRTIIEPARWVALAVAVVEATGDLVLEEVVQRGGLEVVATVVVLDALGGRDRPAVLAVVHLVPPAVEDRQVEAAVQRRLHARRATGLERAQRVVEPDVAARVEVLRHGDVVVGQEDDAVPDLGVVGEPYELLDELLAAVVSRVGLARDDDLDRSGRVEQQRLEPFGVAHHQREALVRRHAPGKPDGQDVGVEDLVDPGELGRAGAALQPARAQPLSRLVDEPLAEQPAGAPDLAVGDVLEGGPRLTLLGEVRSAGDPLDEVERLARDPRRGVHAVGHRLDRDLVLVEGRPEAVEHLRG